MITLPSRTSDHVGDHPRNPGARCRELAGLTPKQRGRKATKNPLADEVAQLQRELKRMQKELDTANTVIDVQRKVTALAVMQALAFLIPLVGIVAACCALGVSRASCYRAQKPRRERPPRPRPGHALTDAERARVLATIDGEQFMDLAPAESSSGFRYSPRCVCSRRERLPSKIALLLKPLAIGPASARCSRSRRSP